MTWVGATCVGAVKQRLLADPIDRRPVPALEAYREWAAAMNHRAYDPQKLRRAVVMRRRGESWADIGRAVGKSSQAIKMQYDLLPESLQ